MGTYGSTLRADSTLHGECPGQGMILTKTGEAGTRSAAGVGRYTGKGAAASFRGATFFHNVPASLARQGRVAVLYEWEIDEAGNARAPIWEWK